MRHEHLDHLRHLVDEGESPLTPAVLIGIVIVCVVPLVAILIALADGAGHFG